MRFDPRNRNREQRPLSSDDVLALSASLRKLTRLPANVRSLEPGDARELRDLLGKARQRVEGEVVEGKREPSLDALSKKDRARCEQLIERSAGEKYIGAFANERAASAHRAEMDSLMAKARRQKRVRHEEEGSVILPALVFQHLRDRFIAVDDLLVLTLVLEQLENAEVLNRGSRIEGFGDDAELVIPRGGRLVRDGLDERELLPGWPNVLDWLHEQGWLRVTKRGETRIARGPRWLKAVAERGGTTPKERTAA